MASRSFLLTSLLWAASLLACQASDFEVTSFQSASPTCQAGSPVTLVAVLKNGQTQSRELTLHLSLPTGVHFVGKEEPPTSATVDASKETPISWHIQADQATKATIGLEIEENGSILTTESATINFLPAAPGKTP